MLLCGSRFLQASALKPDLVLEADGHLAVIRALSDNIMSTDEAKTASLNLLSELCEGSSHRKEVVSKSADDCIHNCVAFLAGDLPVNQEVVSKGTNDEVDSENIPPEGNDVGDGQPSNNIDEKKTPLAIPKVEAADKKFDEVDGNLKLAVLSFLTQMVTIKRCREIIVQEPAFLEAVINVAKTTCNQSLEYNAIALLSSISPFVHQIDSKNSLVILFVSALEKKNLINRNSTKFGRKSLSFEDRMNRNLLSWKAADGLECLIESIPSIDALVDVLSQHCNSLITGLASGLANASILKESGRFMASCTSIFILIGGSVGNGKEALMRVPVLQMLVRLALIDPKQLSSDFDTDCWLLARNQTLFCLAALMRWTACPTDIEWLDVISLAEDSRSSTEGTVKKFAQKNRFGRRTSSINEESSNSHSGLKGILNEIIKDGSDRGASIAAEKILQVIG